MTRPPMPAPRLAIHDATRITKHLWMGSYPDADALARLERAGFRLVVYCAKERPPSVHRHRRLRTLHVPLDDRPDAVDGGNNAAALAAAQAAADRIVRELHAERRVLVACSMGINRSGFVIALVLARLAPHTDADALVAFVQARRHPSLCNPQLVEALRYLTRRSAPVHTRPDS